MSDFRRMAETAYPFRTSAGVDHKAWAKRIMDREKRNDPELLAVQVNFAKQALGLMPMPNGDKKQ